MLTNQFGHRTNYSAVPELETAITNAVMLQDSILPSDISITNNKFSHTCWDNFDILEETASGSGTTHNTYGVARKEKRQKKKETTGQKYNVCICYARRA